MFWRSMLSGIILGVCPICTDTFCRSDQVRLLPCGHSFHPLCIDPWLLSLAKTCPMWYVPTC